MYRSDNTKIRPTTSNPELVDLVTDFAIFTRKWTPPKLAGVLGITKQGLNVHINKRKAVKS